MLKSQVALASHGFRHVCRSLKEGETLPKLPSLMEQILACQFMLPGSDEEVGMDDEFGEEDHLEEELAEAA
ncbi:MAG: hypothetical protein WBP72_14925 [Rhodocyclaceae bacterium]